MAVDCNTPEEMRRKMTDDFRLGVIDILVNVDIFSEGFDCPDVEFVQLARPTLSLSRYMQMVGRGLRTAAGKDFCVIMDNVGACRLFSSLFTRLAGTVPGKGEMLASQRV